MTTEELAAVLAQLTALEGKASLGDWCSEPDSELSFAIVDVAGVEVASGLLEEDAALIVTLRNEAADALKALAAENAKLQDGGNNWLLTAQHLADSLSEATATTKEEE